jgi:integrase
MASLHKQTGNRPGYKLRFRDAQGRQRVLWLGHISKKNADLVCRHVANLAEAVGNGLAAEVDSLKWANQQTGRLRQRLAEWGYVGPERRNTTAAESRLCKSFFDAYIQSRSDWDQKTRINYQQAANCFIKRFGKNRLLCDVTPADIDAWRLWMRRCGRSEATTAKPALGYAESTTNKHAKRIKKLFAQAVRAKLISESPAADQKIGGEVNRARDHYVDAACVSQILTQCDKDMQTEWALIFGLCRFAGFRCPTEVLGLTWSDVNWAENRLRIDSVKTGLRYCPIFPELKPLLEAAFEQAPDGSTYCIRRYRGNGVNLRTQFLRLLDRAGVKPWQKLFVNLRSSCRTDLQERFPDHVVNSWLGHSSRVAERHYLQITEAHWERATTEPTLSPKALDSSSKAVGGNAGGNICEHPQESTPILEAKNPENLSADAPKFPGILIEIPPTGIEPVTRL